MRARWKRPAAGGAAALLSLALLALPAQALTVSAEEWEVLDRVNQARGEAGLEPLSVFEGIQQAAGTRASELVQEYRSDHTRPDGASCFTALREYSLSYRTAGENIAAGYRSPAEVVEGWMNSPGHRSNILSADFTHLGVGYDRGNALYDTVWEQMFLGGGCSFSELRVEPAYRTAGPGEMPDPETLEGTVYVRCSVHGLCALPLSGSMCTPVEGGFQVTYQGLHTQLPVRSVPWKTASSWAESELMRAWEAGLIPESLSGMDASAPMTRAEYAGVVLALYESMGGTAPAERVSFTDTEDPAVERAAALGLVSGVGGGRFQPDGRLTREQAAVMLSNVWRALGGTVRGGALTFPDRADISPWAAEAVAFLAGQDLIRGDGAGRFCPRDALTRESALLLAVRMKDLTP